jgi:hypothetical protein
LNIHGILGKHNSIKKNAVSMKKSLTEDSVSPSCGAPHPTLKLNKKLIAIKQ